MIENIIIENFKSIKRMELKLAPINILIGANGAGKSNFISFFELAKQVHNGNIRDYSLRKLPNNLLHGGLKNADYILGLIDFDNKNAYKFELHPRNDESLYVSNAGDYWNQFELENKDYSKWQWKSANHPYREARDFYVNGYIDSFRVYHFHDTSDSAPIKQTGAIEDNRQLNENGNNLAAFLYFLQEKHPNNFKRIEMAVRSIAPFFDRFDLKPRQIDASQIKLEWKERGSDMYLDARNLSDGTLRFMALSTLLLQPEPPQTIIIDEPELGLHPFAIQKLAALIQKVSSGSQVIVSTQSVEFVSQFVPEDIITVDREGGQSVFRRLENENLERWLESYTLGDVWQKNVIGGQP